MAFNPKDHLMQLKGKDYLQVMWRLVWFREEKPMWSIDTALQEADADHAVFKAVICDENGLVKSTGHGSESKRDFGDFLEKAETKAVGRALAMLGYGTQFTALELDEGERIVDSPVNLTPSVSPEEVAKKKLEQLNTQVKTFKCKATPEQIEFIKSNADDETYMKAMQAFGSDLELMTNGQANMLIKRIKEAGSNGSD